MHIAWNLFFCFVGQKPEVFDVHKKIHLSIHAFQFRLNFIVSVCSHARTLCLSFFAVRSLFYFSHSIFRFFSSRFSAFLFCHSVGNAMPKQTEINVQTWIDFHLNLHFVVFILACRWGNRLPKQCQIEMKRESELELCRRRTRTRVLPDFELVSFVCVFVLAVAAASAVTDFRFYDRKEIYLLVCSREKERESE